MRSSTPAASDARTSRPTAFTHVDREAFARDLDALRTEAEKSLGPDDHAHLRRMARWGRWCTALGYATAWVAPNPLSAVLISTGAMARWTIVVHHTSHRAMDRIPGVPERETSRGFAKGRRRITDWFDWIDPEAWAYEHNVLHHAHTGERADPDLVEENTSPLRDARVPHALKLAVVGAYALTWKLTYYAPNTWQVLSRARSRRQHRERTPTDPALADARSDEHYLAAFDLRTPDGRAFWQRCVLPYGLLRFVVIPGVFAPLGPWAVASVWANSVAAEALTNAHAFAVIATNHAGDDLYRFDTPAPGRGEYYLRQVVGSVNFRTGGDLNDFLHGFLNYQIEHHLFPDLPPRQYQRIQPAVRAVCEKHGVPYVQQSVFGRVRQLVNIMTGRTSMLRA